MGLFDHKDVAERPGGRVFERRLAPFVEARDEQPHQKRLLVVVADVLQLYHDWTLEEVFGRERARRVEHHTFCADQQTGETRLESGLVVHLLLLMIALAANDLRHLPVEVAQRREVVAEILAIDVNEAILRMGKVPSAFAIDLDNRLFEDVWHRGEHRK